MSTPDALAAMAEEIRELRRRLDELYSAEWPLTDYNTYTPTLTGVANVAASTAYACQYLRVGSVVTVSGKMDIDPTAAAPTGTQIGISLPIASAIASQNQLGGGGWANSLSVMQGPIYGDATNDRAEYLFSATSTANTGHFFTFTYLVV